METKDLSSSSLDNQTPIEGYAQTKPNGQPGLVFIPPPDMNGNDDMVNESEPIHQGPSLVNQSAVDSSRMDHITNGTEKATVNGTPGNGNASEFVHPLSSGYAKGITDISNLKVNGEADPNTNGLAGEETHSVPTIEVNGETGEEGYVNRDIIGPEDEDDKETQVIPEIADSGPAKKKKKPKSKRGLKNPTGFEDYYVDAPLTPAEHEQEKGLYHESVPFRERIEIAIQRFFAKRNLNSERKDVFDKYMTYGGVDSGPKMFSGGLDAKTLSDSTAPEIATLTAKHSVGADKGEGDESDKGEGDESDFVVDFEGVAKGFLSTQSTASFDLFNEDAVKFRIGVIRNFLNYLLHHDVCPEYNDQIYAAREVCDQADKELWLVIQAGRVLPGEFNTACSEVFGGNLRGLYVGDQEWAQDFDTTGVGISYQMAQRVLRTGLIARASEESLRIFKKQDDANKIKIMSEIETGLEVMELIPAEEEVLEFYQSPHGKDLKPLGRLRAKTWHYPGAPDEDLTEEEERAAHSMVKETKEYELWAEDHVLEKCFVGMKFITVIKELSFGVRYFDALLGLYCSFYNVLPNEEIIGWREPEKTWLPPRENANGEEADGENEAEGANGANEAQEANGGNEVED